jgi:hypothetical protein
MINTAKHTGVAPAFRQAVFLQRILQFGLHDRVNQKGVPTNP